MHPFSLLNMPILPKIKLPLKITGSVTKTYSYFIVYF